MNLKIDLRRTYNHVYIDLVSHEFVSP